MIRNLYILLLLPLLSAVSLMAQDNEVGYIEDFALAEDREAALDQLVPGTEDYYFYRALHLQNQRKLDEVDAVLEQWLNRLQNKGQRYRVIENRQALLRYGMSPEASLEHLKNQLRLHFNHPKPRRAGEVQYPTELDQATIALDEFLRRAWEQRNDLNGFTDYGLWLVRDKEFRPEIVRELLNRLRVPDYPGLLDLIVRDLENRRTPGYGSLEIHKQLTEAQLVQLLERVPDLINNDEYIGQRIMRMTPPENANWQANSEVRGEFLQRLWDFVESLPPHKNSLKAHVLYHLLQHKLSQGEYDLELFMVYLQIPRHVHYLPQPFRERNTNGAHYANLGQNFEQTTGLGPIHNDYEMIVAYLRRYLKDADNFNDFAPYINEDLLERIFAEVKITNGIGDPEEWASMLSPAEFQQLKERVDLEFVPTNKRYFRGSESVSLDVVIKNVDTLIVKVFEINALNYYREQGRPVSTNIMLDGLVANEERTFDYPENPYLRIRRNFQFPELKTPGVYVVELIGNGKSSRAVIRKGQLSYSATDTVAGQIIRVFNQDNELVEDAAVYVDDKEYSADDKGRIVVPFTTNPSRKNIILVSQELAILEQFNHHGENYSLEAGFHVDRESLLRFGKAKVIVNTDLRVNGEPAPLDLLEDAKLTIKTVDNEGTPSSIVIGGLELSRQNDLVQEFTVPDRLRSITFTLEATVESISTGDDVDLSADRTFELNGLVATQLTQDIFLNRSADGYKLRLLGRSGEPIPETPVRVIFYRTGFQGNISINTTLQTDEEGEIELGELEGVSRIIANASASPQRDWNLEDDIHSHERKLHGKEGVPLFVPYFPIDGEMPGRAEVAFYRLSEGRPAEDLYDQLMYGSGYIVLQDLEAGNYTLYLKALGEEIDIAISTGEAAAGYLISSSRLMEITDPRPLQLVSHEVLEDRVRLHFANAGPTARVHIIATRFEPTESAYWDLKGGNLPFPWFTDLFPRESQYLEGRDIGDEYRYVLERRLARKFPGNMLERPSLLLNPWVLTETDAGREQLQEGTEYADRAMESHPGEPMSPAQRRAGRASTGGREADQAQDMSPNLDFLPYSSIVITNLKPEQDGTLDVPFEALGSKQHLHVIALDLNDSLYKGIALPEKPLETRDLTLEESFDVEKHFAEQKKVSVVGEGEQIIIEDRSTASMELFDTVSDVYGYFQTLSGNEMLAEWAFVARWNQLSEEEKREKFNEYESHDLNFFLHHKDPNFFANTVRPYLANKKDPDFMDHYLLGDDLSQYREPWEYGRLNTLERLLLAEAIEAEREYTVQLINDKFANLPPQVELFNHYFRTALGGQILRADDDSGVVQFFAGAAGGARFGRMNNAMAPATEAAAMKMESESRARGAILAGETQQLQQAGQAFADGFVESKAAVDKLGALQEEYAYATDFALGLDESDLERLRDRGRALYQKLETTKAWIENYYYHLQRWETTPDLVEVDPFWHDYANRDRNAPFLSRNLGFATGNFHEMMLALAVIDLPFEAAEHDVQTEDLRLELTAGSRAIVFHQEIEATAETAENPLLVSQNYFDPADATRVEDGEQVEKYVQGEFLAKKVYGARVVITNPSSGSQRVDVLMQVPEGAIPVSNGFYARSRHVLIPARGTQAFEYFFYFPNPGEFAHYPVQVAKNGKLVTSVEATTLRVVDKPSEVSSDTWEFISQYGEPEAVLEFLRERNLVDDNLTLMAWRMSDKSFFEKALDILSKRHLYNDTLWSYGIRHNAPEVIQEFLEHQDHFVRACGLYLDSPLLTIDPVERHYYRHIEYKPLVNPRAHQLGERPRILNHHLRGHYHEFLSYLAYVPELDDEQRLSVVYYMLLQDRVAEAIAFFHRVNPQNIDTRVQYDYAKAYIAFYEAEPALARRIALDYENYPVPRWRERFAEVLKQVAQIDGEAEGVTDPEDRDQRQGELAATEPNLEVDVEAGQVNIAHQNLDQATVHIYKMDLELLFSRNPFVQHQTEQFAYIKPNITMEVELPGQSGTRTVALPAEARGQNIMVQVASGGQRDTALYYANSLTAQIIESYGQVKVTATDGGKPLPRTYVKVYALMNNGQVQFYKDGYTDLRGRFDYASLNSDDLNQVRRFALLVMSPENGSVVREAPPPQR